VFQILESTGIKVKLVNAHYVKTVPGRKSDVKDCQWLQQLHTYGLLSGSFRPEEQVCVLRSYIRHRDTLIKSASSHVQRMQKALIQMRDCRENNSSGNSLMNLQLHKVISDITGLTGMAIIRAIVAGEQDPQVLAALKNSRIKSSTTDIAKALTGDYRAEHLFVLQQELALYDVYQQQIAACDLQIEQCLASFDTKVEAPPPPRRTKKRITPTGNNPKFDLHSHLYRICGVDFTQIDGLEALSVQTILSEVGLDPTRFPTVKHFTSQVGVMPWLESDRGKEQKFSDPLCS
jgi:hypothetical protein